MNEGTKVGAPILWLPQSSDISLEDELPSVLATYIISPGTSLALSLLSSSHSISLLV